MSLVLKNPHSVLEILKTRPKAVKKLLIAEKHENSSSPWAEVLKIAKKLKIPVQDPKTKQKDPGKKKPVQKTEERRTASAEAEVEPKTPIELEKVFHKKTEGYGLWLALDCLQDPHNVGAIFRTASFFGISGIIMMQDRAAPLSGIVYDTASGGVEHVPFCIVGNLKHALQKAKDSDVWVLGASEHAKLPLKSIGLDRHRIIVIGNEEKGMRRLTEEQCDEVCKIPSLGKVGSLNASVAAGIMMSHFRM